MIQENTTPAQRLRSDLTLLLVAVIWGSAFVAQRVAAGQVGVFLYTGLRFLLATLVLLPLAWRRGRVPGRSLRWILLAGLILFAASNLQQWGLRYTTAGNAGFITTLYVVLIPLMLVFFFSQHLRPVNWVAALMAVTGLFLLSARGQLRLAPGDALELAGAVFWALHVIVLSLAVREVDVLHLSVGQYLVNGALNLLLGLAFERGTLPAVAGAWWSIAYTGLFSVAVGYTLQAVGQKHAPPADAAVILSTESAFAALSGFLFLGEQLAPLQILGCGLILAASLLVQLWNRPKAASATIKER